MRWLLLMTAGRKAPETVRGATLMRPNDQKWLPHSSPLWCCASGIKNKGRFCSSGSVASGGKPLHLFYRSAIFFIPQIKNVTQLRFRAAVSARRSVLLILRVEEGKSRGISCWLTMQKPFCCCWISLAPAITNQSFRIC